LTFNLMENAVKYSSNGGVVYISLKSSEGVAEFRVEDSAALIALEKRERIFEPFYRLKSEASGSGLGLTLVQWIAGVHRAEVRLTEGAVGNVFEVVMVDV